MAEHKNTEVKMKLSEPKLTMHVGYEINCKLMSLLEVENQSKYLASVKWSSWSNNQVIVSDMDDFVCVCVCVMPTDGQ